MLRGKVQTTIRWAWAFANVMLHTCTPIRAADIVGPGVVVTIPGDARFGHASLDPHARSTHLGAFYSPCPSLDSIRGRP
jgi:hypothetical protein